MQHWYLDYKMARVHQQFKCWDYEYPVGLRHNTCYVQRSRILGVLRNKLTYIAISLDRPVQMICIGMLQFCLLSVLVPVCKVLNKLHEQAFASLPFGMCLMYLLLSTYLL
jgi:hypothetical protein